MNTATTALYQTAQDVQIAAGLLRFEVEAIPLRPLEFLPFGGSMLRGAFGHALRHRYCKCPVDQHTPVCLYARVFEGFGAKGAGSPTPRFVITPPAPGIKKSGEPMRFQITLFDLTHHEVSLALEALVLALRRGLGSTPVIPMEVTGIWPVPMTWTPLNREVQLILTSPWLIKRHGEILDATQTDAAAIIWAAARRMCELDGHYALGIKPPSREAVEDCLKGLRCLSQLTDCREQRRSNRQQRTHPLAGVIGTLHLVHDQPDGLAPLTRLLNFTRWLHGGGKCALGLGALELEH